MKFCTRKRYKVVRYLFLELFFNALISTFFSLAFCFFDFDLSLQMFTIGSCMIFVLMSIFTFEYSDIKHTINKMYPDQYLEYDENKQILVLTTYNFKTKRIEPFEIKISDILEIKKEYVEFFEVYFLFRGKASIEHEYKYKWAKKVQKKELKKCYDKMKKDNIGNITIELKDEKFELVNVCNLDQEYEHLEEILSNAKKAKKTKS